MEPNGLDPSSTVALVLRTIEDVKHSTDEERDELLFDLICAAWGSRLAQCQ